MSIEVECIHSDERASAGAMKLTMLSDERTRDIIVRQVFGEGTLIVADGEILPNLEVQVSDVHAAISPDRPDLLATHDLLPLEHEDFVEMRIDRVHGFDLSLFEENVADDHQVSPAHAHVTRKDDDTVCRRIHRFAQIAIASLEAIPIFSHVVASSKAA